MQHRVELKGREEVVTKPLELEATFSFPMTSADAFMPAMDIEPAQEIGTEIFRYIISKKLMSSPQNT